MPGKTYDFTLVIEGMNTVPLRTTREGVLAIMESFDVAKPAVLLKAVRDGATFSNHVVTIKRVKRPIKKKEKA